MPKTTLLDNRLRIPQELWTRFLDACAEDHIPPKEQVIALMVEWMNKRKYGTGEVHLAPQPIPFQKPPQRSEYLNELTELF